MILIFDLDQIFGDLTQAWLELIEPLALLFSGQENVSSELKQKWWSRAETTFTKPGKGRELNNVLQF